MKNSHTPKCPACQRNLQNRLVNQCLYCGETVPDHLKLTDEEKADIRQEQSAQLAHDRKLREQREAEDKERRERFQGNADDGLGIFPFLF